MGLHANIAFAKWAMVMLLTAGLAACAGAPGPAPTGTDTAWHGNLTEGGKFGATVGQTARDAQREMLATGYGFEGELICASETRFLPGCATAGQYLEFQPVRLGQRGHVYLRIESGLVSQIVWELTPVAYLDG